MMHPVLAQAILIADLQRQLAEVRADIEIIAGGFPALQSYADKAAIGAAVQVRHEFAALLAADTAAHFGRVDPSLEARARRSRLTVLAGGAA